MISEPELVGGDPFDAPGGSRGAQAGPPPPEAVGTGPDGAPPARAPRPAWLWAVGGAAAASVLWAGGLYGCTALGPDLGGYRATENLCAEAELKGLTSVMGKPAEEDTMGMKSRHATVDQASCSLSMRPTGYEPPTDEDGNEIWSLPMVHFTYTLHKKTDPGPEFDGLVLARNEAGETGDEPRRTSGIGERGFVFSEVDDLTVEVLDGQATFRIWVSGARDPETGEPVVDMTGIEATAVDDLKALMERLKG